jgi:hypothetical protein
MKKTAVEWLAEQMIIHMDIRIENTTIGLNLLEQAEKMEKEQIENAYNVGNPYKTAEQYYNQTFKQD